jgi:arylsulfatase A-like enzyme
MISIDDLNDYVGFLGGYAGAIHTPNLDRLAARGVAFTNAHVQAPLCGPSRASLLSGLRPSTTGVYGMIDDDSLRNASPALEDIIFLPEYFADHGYRTLGIGKIFHQHAPEGVFAESGGRYPGFGPLPEERFRWSGLTDRPGFGRTSTDWGAFPDRDTLMPDYASANWAVEQLGKDHANPFFLAVGFLRPHVPLYVPPAWFELYPRDSIVLPPYFSADTADLPTMAHQINDLPMMPSTDWAIRSGEWTAILQAYLASISFVDAQLGRILDALEASDYADNTIIVLWSDHGYRMGEKGTFAKHCLWETATRVPFIVAGPGIEARRIDQPAELLSIYPTLLELAGLPAYPRNEGRSLAGLIRGTSDVDPAAVAITTFGYGNHAVRTARYRYIRYENGGEELYDHASDPEEWFNLATAPVPIAIGTPILQRLRNHLPTDAPWAAASSYDWQPYFAEQKARR